MDDIRKEKYHISGMTCSACSAHVEKAVNKLKGVERAGVNLLTETMEIVYDGSQLSTHEIVSAVEKAGYGADMMDRGKGTGACRQAGAQETTAGNRKGAAAQRTGASAGQEENGREAFVRKTKEESKGMKRRLGISIVFLIPLMYVAMYHMYHNLLRIPVPDFVLRLFHGGENAMTFALTQLLLLLPILYVNRKFFEVGFKTLGHFSPNMDSLIAIGASAAVGYGIFAMYRISWGLGHGRPELVEHYSHDLYFESAGMILTLITVGKFLEARSKKKTGDAITGLMNLAPRLAVVLGEDGQEREIPTEELRQGDIFLVKPGSLVPADGTVLQGSSSVDEAAITGESVPVEKQEGDQVVSATMNKAGFLKCRADRVGEDTTLSQIIRLVEEAGGSKAPIARLADKVAGVFVPVVMGIALLTLAGWLMAGAGPEFAISTAISVLVISCPCALGLATPVAIMVGTGVGAKNGVLIKSGEALQAVRDIDTVVLDKTGTITEGRLMVMEIYSDRGVTPDRIVSAAAAVEKQSEHPLAEAVIREAQTRKLSLPAITDFQAVFGRGIQGILAEDLKPERTWEEDRDRLREDGPVAEFGTYTPEEKVDLPAGTCLLVGNEAYLKEQGICLTARQKEWEKERADEGMTPLWVAAKKDAGEKDEGEKAAGIVLGAIAVADEVKATSRRAIRALKKMGIHVVMLTGDNKRTAEAVRKRVDLEEVIAEVLPQDKERHISALQEAGHKVAMIGDGINDAPALAAADVGMAIGAGTDIAMESADIILMKNDLRDAVTAIALSRAVIRNIKENLFWAFFYNCIGIPLAAGLLYPGLGLRLNPMFGAAAMSMSSLFVVGNALRLRGFKGPFGGKRKTTEQETEAVQTKQTEQGMQKDQTEQTMPRKELTNNQTGQEIVRKERKEEMTKVITIQGMMCSHCTDRVQKALAAVKGVEKVVMSLEDKTATVTLSEEVPDELLTGAVSEAGYETDGIASH